MHRVGGISEAQKVWAMAAAHDIPVIPHAGQSHNYHLVISHLNSPIAEYFPPPPEGVLPDMNEAFWWIFTGEPLVEDGHVRSNEVVVAFITGAGLKTQEAVLPAINRILERRRHRGELAGPGRRQGPVRAGRSRMAARLVGGA